MLVLFAERRAVRKALVEKHQQLRSSNAGKTKDAPDRLTGDQIKTTLSEYEASLDPSRVVADLDSAKDGLSILDALAASGLRSLLRYTTAVGRNYPAVSAFENGEVISGGAATFGSQAYWVVNLWLVLC